MITVFEADKIIFGSVTHSPTCQVPLHEASGLVLRECLIADRDLPPFNRSMMDGIAIAADAYLSAIRDFTVEGIQKAGEAGLKLSGAQACVEIMTGAVIPVGADCVVPIEHVEMKGGSAHLKDGEDIKGMDFIHAQGSDQKQGDVLVDQGVRLLPPHIAVAASCGYDTVSVAHMPRIAVIGTGDELVPVADTPELFQIRQSNSYALQSACLLHHFSSVERFHIKDDKGVLEDQLTRILNDFDVVVLSGGVSMGKFDFVPEVLANLGVDVLFHKVAQRPGKPFWFGRNTDGKPVFALPGNPVSTQVCFYRYVLPYLNKAVGLSSAVVEYASLKEDVQINTPLTQFLPVSIESSASGQLLASALLPNSSGDFASLARCHGFCELPAETFRFPAGFSARFFRF